MLKVDDRSTGTAAGQVPVKIVDTDVHPVPRSWEVLAEYTPEPWRSRMYATRRGPKPWNNQPAGPMENATMRADATPPGGGPPCSDPEFAFEQLIRGAKVDIAVLNQLQMREPHPDASLANCQAQNQLLVEHWLDGNNQHERWVGCINVPFDNPAGGAREIEKWAGHPRVVGVQMVPETRMGFGHPHFDPIYEAATRHGLPVATHIARGPFEQNPMSPVGYQSYWHSHNAGSPMTYMSHLFSLVFDGAFDRFPTLKFAFVEGAFSWLLPALWRMDRYWEARKAEVPWVTRRPSEYVRDQVRVCTQPLEEPDDGAELTRLLEWMESDTVLMFSSDYPHWTFDDPTWAALRFPKGHRDRVLHQNAIDFYGLPSTVPAIG
jgi:predicted TIM-barrel fold metal-dependent hydrolase